jgi:hypothetical protein
VKNLITDNNIYFAQKQIYEKLEMDIVGNTDDLIHPNQPKAELLTTAFGLLLYYQEKCTYLKNLLISSSSIIIFHQIVELKYLIV